MIDPIRFKFRFVDDKGAESGGTKKGSFDGETLLLGAHAIPAAALLRAVRRFNHLFIAALDAQAQSVTIVVAIKSGSAPHLLSAINQLASAHWAQLRQQRLRDQGEEHRHVVEQCPHCHCTIELTDMPRSAQVYCPFCYAVSTRSGRAPADEAKFRLCDNCGFFALPEDFTIFYFYFLIAFYGFSTRQVHRCHSCMRGEAWKMLAGNFLFVLGIIPSLVQLRRAYRGGARRSDSFSGLDEGNARAKKKDADGAAGYYQAIEDQLGCCAGVRYNHGLAYLLADRPEDATVQFQHALLDCANYRPAYDALATCYTQLGRHDALAQLQRLWGEQDDALPSAT